MGLFNFFKKPIKIQDPVFGELNLTAFRERSKDFFTGEGYFNKENPKVGFIIHAESAGPAEAQYTFYKKLQEDYPALIEKMIPLITDEFLNWKEDFRILDFNTEFKMDSVTIPNQAMQPMVWDICFTTIHDKNHWVTVNFLDAEPDFVMVDG